LVVVLNAATIRDEGYLMATSQQTNANSGDPTEVIHGRNERPLSRSTRKICLSDLAPISLT